MEVRELEPSALWNHFADLNTVPRASKKEAEVIAFMVAFGEQLGLETVQDSIGNVVIRKPATAGMEDRQTVVLQSHLDMVHQKNGDTDFDFATQGIEMLVDEDWVRAKGTTLGADNGIGVATIMAVLTSTEIPHPAIEAMFTIDEETGMTGAKELDPSNFTGKILLNLDTEEDDELTIGCAGGIDTNTSYNYEAQPANTVSTTFQITVKGLMGGHSGMDIHKGRANANKLMNRLLFSLVQKVNLQLSSLDGGSLRNAIPRESNAVVVVPMDQIEVFKSALAEFIATITEEYKSVEAGLNISATEIPAALHVINHEELIKILNTIYALPNGVFRMSPDIENLVEASSNLARVIVKEGLFTTQSLQRSSVESTKTDVSNAIRAAFENMGAAVQQGGDYPGWKSNADSDILRLMVKLYEERFGAKPKVEACHAGLECGIIGGHLPGMDMISFGPTIHGAHSPDERVKISSVQKFWGYFLSILEQIPQKK